MFRPVGFSLDFNVGVKAGGGTKSGGGGAPPPSGGGSGGGQIVLPPLPPLPPGSPTCLSEAQRAAVRARCSTYTDPVRGVGVLGAIRAFITPITADPLAPFKGADPCRIDMLPDCPRPRGVKDIADKGPMVYTPPKPIQYMPIDVPSTDPSADVPTPVEDLPVPPPATADATGTNYIMMGGILLAVVAVGAVAYKAMKKKA
jgi:hypothetical protein